MKLLVLTDRCVFPPSDGETYAMAGQVRELMRYGDVDILYVRRFGQAPAAISLVEEDGIARVFSLHAPPAAHAIVRGWRELACSKPYFLVPPASPDALRCLLQGERYEVVYVGLPRLMAWVRVLEDVLPYRFVKVLCVNDAITQRFRFHAGLAKLPLSWKCRLRNLVLGLRSVYFANIEKRLLSEVDILLVQTEVDRAAMHRDCGAETASRVVVFPNGHKPELLQIEYSSAGSRRLLFLGTVGAEVRGLLEWFLSRVLQPLGKVVNNVKLEVVGGINAHHRGALQRFEMVSVRGFVPNLTEAFSGSCMMVCPSFMRGGLLNKVVDAMAAGVPCSGIGAFNGIRGFQNGVHGLSVASAEEWVRVLTHLLRTPNELSLISASARQLVSRMSWEANASAFRSRLTEMLSISSGRGDKNGRR